MQGAQRLQELQVEAEVCVHVYTCVCTVKSKQYCGTRTRGRESVRRFVLHSIVESRVVTSHTQTRIHTHTHTSYIHMYTHKAPICSASVQTPSPALTTPLPLPHNNAQNTHTHKSTHVLTCRASLRMPSSALTRPLPIANPSSRCTSSSRASGPLSSQHHHSRDRVPGAKWSAHTHTY